MVSLCGRGFDSLQLHPTIREVAVFQRLLLFLSALLWAWQAKQAALRIVCTIMATSQ